jgi:predicted MPP superfamily phosphohydrolase
MEQSLTPTFWWLALITAVGVPMYGGWMRGRGYAVFALVVLLLSLPGAVIMHGRLMTAFPSVAPLLDAAFVYSMAAAGIHLAALVTARLRSSLFRLAISIPAMTFVAAGAISGAWLLALIPIRATLTLLGWHHALALLQLLDVIPLVIAGLSVITSTRPVAEIVRITLGDVGDDGPLEVSRLPVERYRRHPPAPLARRPLRVVQITDPHLGPWQPVAKLRRQIEELIRHDPDLVLLTGDFLTMEGIGTPGSLGEALAPLLALPGRCFGIFGNHDHACPDEIRSAFRGAGVELLVDAEAIVETAIGPVQIVGADYVGPGRREHIQTLLQTYPRQDGTLRLLLLHDPLGFKYVPKGDVDLTVSGHTHGGQVGLVSFGLDWTVLSRSRWPDHGLFGHGSNRLYVHRGTGFYGFPLRVGVPGEASLLELVQA